MILTHLLEMIRNFPIIEISKRSLNNSYLSNASYANGDAQIGVDPVGLDGQGHGGELEFLHLVEARYDQSSTTDDHGRGAMHEPRYDEGLVGTHDLHFHV